MPYQRLKHVAAGMNKKNQSECLPIVIVRDPYNWMQSMVRFPHFLLYLVGLTLEQSF